MSQGGRGAMHLLEPRERGAAATVELNARASSQSVTRSPLPFPSVGARPATEPGSRRREIIEAQFFTPRPGTAPLKEPLKEPLSARKAYPRKEDKSKGIPLVDQMMGVTREDRVPRRIMGFGVGFERVQKTTSFPLPPCAYLAYVELHSLDGRQVVNHCFNGLHTVLDLKTWVYEQLLIPTDAYELSYAEPGKAALTDELRLLTTTSESLDTRSLASMRAVQDTYRGLPGVHSIDDVGVTRLYVRLTCRTCGDLLNSLQTCKRMKTFGLIEPRSPEKQPQQQLHQQLGMLPTTTQGMPALADTVPLAPPADGTLGRIDRCDGHVKLKGARSQPSEPNTTGVPGLDPNIEDIWYAPDPKKNCLFHNRGFETYSAARHHGSSHGELARIYVSTDREPSKKLRLGREPLTARGPPRHITY